MKNIFYYDTEIGLIGIADNGKAITGVFFHRKGGNESMRGAVPGPGKAAMENAPHSGNTPYSGNAVWSRQINETPLIKEAASQIREYLAGKRRTFDVPLDIKGTPFQTAVWKALLDIPYGETRTYKEIAAAAGNPGACRAAGMACKRNPAAIIVPCHRVIGSNGSLTGFACGIDIKRKLLDIEKHYINR